MRRYIPLVRAAVAAGLQQKPFAFFESSNDEESILEKKQTVGITEEGKVLEKEQMQEDLNIGTTLPFILQFGKDIKNGIYLYINVQGKKVILCDGREIGIRRIHWFLMN